MAEPAEGALPRRRHRTATAAREPPLPLIDLLDLPLLGGAALLSAFVGSVAGSGSAAVLLPVLILRFGVREAIPIITIANLVANASRAGLYRKELDLPVVGWFILGGVPLTVAGAYLFTITAPEILTRLVGGLLIALLIWRRARPAPPALRLPVAFLPLGATYGFLAGYLSGLGPLLAPFFLAYGLVKGGYIGTDALASLCIQATKLTVFGGRDLLQARILANGLMLTPFTFLGTLLGKKLLDRLPERVFVMFVEAMLAVAGLNFLIRG